MARPVLEVRDLWASDGVGSCEGVWFAVRRGEVLAVVGSRGDGLEVLADCLALSQAPSSGSILLHGVDVAGSTGDRRQALLERAIRVVRPLQQVGVPGPLPIQHECGGSATGPPPAPGGAADVVVVEVIGSGAVALGSGPTVAGDSTGCGGIDSGEVARLRGALQCRSAPAAVVLTDRLAVAAAVADAVVMLDHGVVVDHGAVAHVLAGAGRRDDAPGVSRRSA